MKSRHFFRRLGMWVLAIAVATAFQLPIPVHGATFSDVKGHWAETYITRAVNDGFIKGYPDGTFQPDRAVSRAEFTKMVNSALGNSGTADLTFTDVPYFEWYYNDVSKAVSAAYVNGYDDGTFRPANQITRQEAAVMIARLVPTYGYFKSIVGYADYAATSDWARTALSKVTAKGYIGAYTDGLLHPGDKLSRAQAAKIIGDILEKEMITSSDPSVSADNTKLSGRIYTNNVTLKKELADGDATLDNCVVLGTLTVLGGGSSTITVSNSRVANATVNKSDSNVRVLAKGETSIAQLSGLQTLSLETSSLAGGTFGTGFEKISLGGSSSATLDGTFPSVSIDGSYGKLNLASGAIDNLSVSSGGRRSDITVQSGATIKNAAVHAESYFHGTGTITSMQVYAKSITYETKPRGFTIGTGGETPTLADPVLDVAISPANGATDVYLDKKITLTFSTAMKLYSGNTITSSNISDFVELRSGSSSGSKVSYSASIDSAKKVITITPNSNLSASARYYVILKASTLLDSYGNDNDAKTIYFNTGDATEKLTLSYSPANGETAVPLTSKSFTISFSDSLIKYSGSSFSSSSDSYLESSVVLLRKGSSSSLSNQTAVANADYSVSINSARRIITVTMNDYLNLDTYYSVGINTNTMKTTAGTTVTASSVTWKTAGAPALSSATLTPFETSLDLQLTPSVNGTLYAVVVPDGTIAPTASAIKDGKDGSGNPVLVSASAVAVTNTANKLSLTNASGLGRDTIWDVYAVLYDNAGNYSSVVSLSEKTKSLSLRTLSIVSNVDGVTNLLSNFSGATTSYSNILVPNTATSITVAAVANSSDYVGEIKINDQSVNPLAYDLTWDSSGAAIVTVTLQEATKSVTTYTVGLKKAGNASLGSMSIGGNNYMPGDTYSFADSTTDVAISINIQAADATAQISLDGVSETGTWQHDLNVSRDATPVGSTIEKTFTISAANGTASQTYTIRLLRTAI